MADTAEKEQGYRKRMVDAASRMFQPDDKFGDPTRIMREAPGKLIGSIRKDIRSLAVLTGLVPFNEADDRPLRQRLSDSARTMMTPDDKVETIVRRQAGGLSQTVGDMAIRLGLKARAPGDVGDGFVLSPRAGYAPRDPSYVREAETMKKEMKPLLDAAVGRFEKASDAEVIGMLGSAKDREHGATFPPILPRNGAARRNAIRAMTLKAFSDERLDDAKSPHSPAFNSSTRELMRHPVRVAEIFTGKDNFHDVNRQFARGAISSTSYVMAGGKALDARVESETRAIMAAPDFEREIAERFARSPKTDLREPPSDVEGRREWVSGSLRTEAAFLAKGLIRGDDVLYIAASVRGPVPEAGPDARIDTVRATGAALRTGRHDYEDAKNLERLPEAALRHRFRDIPGVEKAEIGRNQADWVARSLSIERTRDVMKSAGIADDPSRSRSTAGEDRTISMSREKGLERLHETAGPKAEVRRPGVAAQAAAASVHRGMGS